ncbi:hypothetical protein HMI56_000410 [Coelomomyces lativittatus]|nr:hypothetical protein HMI56_000410 [Coelomomyces lativittatus]
MHEKNEKKKELRGHSPPSSTPTSLFTSESSSSSSSSPSSPPTQPTKKRLRLSLHPSSSSSSTARSTVLSSSSRPLLSHPPSLNSTPMLSYKPSHPNASTSSSSSIKGTDQNKDTPTSLNPNALPTLPSSSSSSSSFSLPTASLPLDLKFKPNSNFMSAIPLFSCPSFPVDSSSSSSSLSRPLSLTSSLPFEANKHILGKKIKISKLQGIFDETPSLTTYSGNMTTMLPMTSHSLLSDMNFDQGSLFVVPGHNTMDIPTPPTSPHVYSPDFPMDTSALYVTPSMWMTTATSECGSNNELYPTTVSALDPSTFYTPALFPASLMCPETRFSPKLSSHQKQSKLLALLENDESESTSMISDPFMSSCTTPSYTTLPSSTLSSSSSSTPSSSSASTLLNISSSSPSLLNYAVADPPCPMPPMLTKQSKKNNHPKGAGSNLLSNLPSFSSSFPGTVTDPVDDALPPFLTKGYPVDPPQRKDMRKKYDTEFTSSVISLSTTSSSSSSTLTSSSLNSMKLYSCARCDKSFKRKADCIRHGRIHTGEKPYKCPGCSESFARQDALRRHQGKGNVKCANALKQYITVNSIAESPEAASLVKHERLETMAKKWVYPNA